MVGRVQRNTLVVARQRHRAEHLEIATRVRQLLHTRFLNQEDERCRAAVHDWHFRGAQLNDGVVDAEADQRAHEMFDRVDPDRVLRQAGSQPDAIDMLDRGRHLESTQVGSPEPDTEVSRRRLQREADFVAGMQTNPSAGDGSTKGPLCAHLVCGRPRDIFQEAKTMPLRIASISAE